MLLALSLGCALQPVAADPPALPRPGVVFVVGGIGGLDPLNMWVPAVLPMAGIHHEMRNFPWTHGIGHLFLDLQDRPHLLAKGRELASAVQAIKAADPDRPVYLLGHSAGTAVSLAAAEQLPPGTLQRIVLLSAAVSPDYDLRPALRATREGIVSFNSGCDVIFLWWGTSQFGTADRVYAASAGLNGFRVPTSLDADGKALYERLIQVHWEPLDLFQFRGGWHHSPCMPIYLATAVAPWLIP
jgi:pimeloyl-ACP methyl ester carboxylesterase